MFCVDSVLIDIQVDIALTRSGSTATGTLHLTNFLS